jgi:hypothetical protein
VLSDGSTRDVRTFGGDVSGEQTIAPPADIAIGSVRWQLVRLVPAQQLQPNGNFSATQPREFAGNAVRIAPRADMAAVLTRTGINFVRQDKVVGHTNLVEILGQSNNFNGAYLTGRKITPIAYSNDLSRVFVAGNSVIYVVDNLSFKLISTVALPAGQNVVSLVTAGDWLIVGEGRIWGEGASNARLLVMNTNPASSRYNQFVSMRGTGVEQSRYGVAGMAVGPDGHTLVVALPKMRDSTSVYTRREPGDVIVLDLRTLNIQTGAIASPVVAALPDGTFGGKSPSTVTATFDADRFLVTNINDYSRGLNTLQLTRDDQGSVTAAKLASISMSQPPNAIRIDRLNIQRSQSAVLVKHDDGVEYAIVADDNYNFLDPYWQAMFEAPMFVYVGPFSPPMAVGGSASAKRVAVGGKLGVVKDPFGKNGAPEFLGATLPLDGTGIINLSLSEDGKVLLGQLKGGYGTLNQFTQLPNQSHVWSVPALIEAALANPPDKRMTKHIRLPSIAEQLVPTNGRPPVGTAFDPADIEVRMTGNMGDIIEVDLKDMIARSLLGLPGKDTKAWRDLGASVIRYEATRIQAKIQELGEVALSASTDWDSYTDPARLAANPEGMQLVTNGQRRPGLAPNLLSRTESGDHTIEYWKTGVFYLAPNITDEEVNLMRYGGRLVDKQAYFTFYYQQRNQAGALVWKQGTVLVTASDYPVVGTEVFYGDRPLDNPGYSAMTLRGTVRFNQTNDRLDVYKVEQRLRYLGFPAMGQNRANTNFNLQNFKVDGRWEDADAKAGYLFYKTVNYGPGATKLVNVPHGSSFNAATYTNALQTASRAMSFDRGGPTVDWLNAWNAPHWVNVGDWITSRSTRYLNTQNESSAGKRENYGTSWMADWLLAQRYAPAGLQTPRELMFSGAVDANHAATPGDHSTHDLGMAFDIGITRRPHMVQATEAIQLVSNVVMQSGASVYQLGGNNNPSTPAGFVSGWSDTNARWFVLPDARTTFPVPGSNNGATTTIRTGAMPELSDPTQPHSNTNPWVYRVPTGKWQGNELNDQRAVLAQILSLYSITNANSAGYQTARAQFLGTVAEKNTKAEALFRSIFSHVYIGQTNTQYKDIRYVLGQLGISNGKEVEHHHHFHIRMSVPTLTPITRTQNLHATEELPMMDLDTYASQPMVVAQASASAPGGSAPLPNWLSKTSDPASYARSVEYIQSNRPGPIDYTERGPRGLPILRTTVFLEKGWGAQEVAVAEKACFELDIVAKMAGAWGPDCVIEKFTKLPKKGLPKAPTGADYKGPELFLFTPSGQRREEARFILSNGAGRKCEVIVTFHVPRQYGVGAD